MTWSAEAQRQWTRPKQPIGSAVALVIFTPITAAHLRIPGGNPGHPLDAGPSDVRVHHYGWKHSRPSRSVPVEVSP